MKPSARPKPDQSAALRRELAAAQAEAKMLREALRPFVLAYANTIIDHPSFGEHWALSGGVTVGDVRRARKALGESAVAG